MAPLIRILTTGGTIATRSTQSGAVMDFNVETLISKLRLDVKLEIKNIMTKGSMNFVPSDWQQLAEAAAEALRSGVDGVVILHGTDTLHYSASALSFMLRDLSVPVVLTGSMIPGGEPGSDSIPNLKDAITVAAYADLAEVCIVFSADRARSRGVIIRGCRARKLHSFAIDAFSSVNIPPIGYVENDKITYGQLHVNERMSRQLVYSNELDPNVVLVKLTPAVTIRSLSRFLEGSSGAVLEGTGVGHLHTDLLDVIGAYGRPVVMSTQAIFGGERLGAYDVDKRILEARNLIPARDMTSETALVKLMWALRQQGELRSLMLTSVSGEISSGS